MIDVVDLLLHATDGTQPTITGAGRRRENIGWGDGLMPFLVVGVPVLAFLLWYEWTRRRR
ncbi:hypothetical protein ACFSCV_15675 [Methylopila henanensis]|uniref:Uncharacterized protein n=1 Tax=Methylopila henanensis TaxID=873516 RepID=A0ABW4K8G9_9HYPH